MTDQAHPTPDDDDVWGTASTAPRIPPTSAFQQPSVVEDATMVASDPEYEAPGQEEEQQTQPSTGPNYGILAAAGLLVVGLLGGVGYVVKDKFFTAKPSREAVVMEVEESVAPKGVKTAPVSVFEDKVSASTSDGNVFDVEPAAPASPAPSAVTTVDAVKPAVAAPVAVAAMAVATAAVVEKAPAFTPVAPVAKVAAVTPPTTAPVGPSSASPEKTADPVVKTVSTPVEPRAKPKPTHVAKAKPHSTRQAQHRTRVAAKTNKSKAVAKAEPKEVFLLPKDVKVQGIFPPVGANVQAWINDGTGRTEVVRVGDNLRSGAQVTAINAEKGEVVTTSGTITSRGVR